jgi:branched-chain amino acid transport system permease protein
LAWICIRLRADYLAIATIGNAEIIKLILKKRDRNCRPARDQIVTLAAVEHFPSEERFYTSWLMSWFGTPEKLCAALDTSLVHWQPLFAGTILLLVMWRDPSHAGTRAHVAVGPHDDSNCKTKPAAPRRWQRRHTPRIEAFIIGAAIMGLAGSFVRTALA